AAPDAYLYTLRAASPSGESPPTTGSVVTPTDAAPGLDASVLQLPEVDTEPRRDSAGHWYFLSNGSLVKTGDASWVPHPYTFDGYLLQPLLDPADAPHLLVLKPSATGTTTDLVHEWFDGTWHSEAVGSVQLPGPDLVPVAWGLDAAGKPVVVTSTTYD